MKNFLKCFHKRPIAYYPIYRELTGSTTGGILLSQLMYWFNKKDKIYKTDAEIMKETLLTEKELRNAKKLIKKVAFLTVSREGIPAKTFYKIDWELYEKVMVELCEKDENENAENGQTSNDEKDKQDTPKGRNCVRPNGETNIYNNNSKELSSYITETTTEITTENNVGNEITDPLICKDQTKEDTEAMKISKYLLSKILSVNPNHKKPNLYAWEKDIDKALRIDKRTPQELYKCIDWIYSLEGAFWQPNILSGKKLREKFDQMKLQASMRTRSKVSHTNVDEIYKSGLTATQIIQEATKRAKGA